MVEVFKTNIQKRKDAQAVISRLKTFLPGSSIHIDLEDCDKVLRVEIDSSFVDDKLIKTVVRESNFKCEELEGNEEWA